MLSFFNSQSEKSARISWVDYAKGLSIILVVQLHSSSGLEVALGQDLWAGVFADFVKSFRMPLFFMVAGLFLAKTIKDDWLPYADRKVLHFAYFYVIWVTIQFALKAGHLYQGDPLEFAKLYLTAFVEPFGTLWFIYVLALCFIVTKLVFRAPPHVLFAAAALLNLLPIESGWTAVDEFCAYYVYFVTGFLFAGLVFGWADYVSENSLAAYVAFVGFLAVNLELTLLGLEQLPGVPFVLGFAGAFAMVGIVSVLADRNWLSFLRYCGERSLYIYLAFFLPMAASRIALLKINDHVALNPELMAFLITVCAVGGAIAIYELARRIGLEVLFKRPDWAHVTGREPAGAAQNA